MTAVMKKKMPSPPISTTCFDDIPHTTMVILVFFEGEIYLDNAFGALPLSIFLSDSGRVSHLAYRGIVRSSQQEVKKRFFKNAIISNIDTPKRMVIHISRQSLHLCGIKKMEEVNNICSCLFAILAETKNCLAEWRSLSTSLLERLQTGLIRTQDHWFIPNLVELGCSTKLADYLLSFLIEYNNKDDYLNQLSWLATDPPLTAGKMVIETVRPVMVNYNYRLDVNIDRYQFYLRVLEDRDKHGFIVTFFNITDYSVQLMLARQPEDQPRYHKFNIYGSGKIAQHGPGGQESKEAFLRLMWLLCQYYPQQRVRDFCSVPA